MNKLFFQFTIIVSLLTIQLTAADAVDKNDALEAMKKSSVFMMETVSTRGGFVWQYSSDLSKRWGEVPARDSQIWVQGATNGVGDMFIDAYQATGDPLFIEYAKKTASAIIWGQHPAGGWHYLIDFDMPGIEKWYEDVASKCWGWEEYYHYYGNCTYDNDATTSSVRFLLRLYMETLDPAYREPLIRGLAFILESQFPNGAWPQRYPLSFEFVKDGHPDYTSYYTFNDGVMAGNIFLLVEAFEKLGDERYMKAAKQGMDFYLISQGAAYQPAWAEQYDWNMRPAWARTYEPDAMHAQRTYACIRELIQFYRITGDKRYVDAAGPALEWLEQSKVNGDPLRKAERAGVMHPYTHAQYYETVTNRPVYVHREGTDKSSGRYYADYTPGNCPCHVLQVVNLDTRKLRREYGSVSALTPAEAKAEYEAGKVSPNQQRIPNADQIKRIIDGMDGRGAWLTDMTIQNYAEPCDISGQKTIRGIDLKVFLRNMKSLTAYSRVR